MSKEGAIKAMKDEIQKCWDDGELAKYDSLLKLVPITGANVVTDVGIIIVYDSRKNGVH